MDKERSADARALPLRTAGYLHSHEKGSPKNVGFVNSRRRMGIHHSLHPSREVQGRPPRATMAPALHRELAHRVDCSLSI